MLLPAAKTLDFRPKKGRNRNASLGDLSYRVTRIRLKGARSCEDRYGHSRPLSILQWHPFQKSAWEKHVIAVGTAVSSRPPHRSVREYTNSYGSSFRSGVKPGVWPRVDDTRFWQMNSHQPSHSCPSPLASLLTASTNLTKPKMEDCITKLLKPSNFLRINMTVLAANQRAKKKTT